MNEVWNWGFVWENLPLLAQGALLTFELTVLGSLLAYVLGLVFAVLRRSSFRPVSRATRSLIEFVRSTPLLVQMFLLFWVLPDYGIRLGAFVTAILALGLHYATYTAEVYRAGIEGVPAGQWEAATALSLPRWRVWTSVVLPQAIPRVVPALGNYTISMFKEIPLVIGIGIVALVGQARTIQGETFRAVEVYTIAGVFFLLFSLLAAFAVRLLERRLGHY